jgi:hypothetical protein
MTRGCDHPDSRAPKQKPVKGRTLQHAINPIDKELWLIAVNGDEDLPKSAFRSAAFRVPYLNKGTARTTVGRDRLAKMSSVSSMTLKRGDLALEDAGYLAVGRWRYPNGGRKSNETSICIPPTAAARLREAVQYMPYDEEQREIALERIDRMLEAHRLSQGSTYDPWSVNQGSTYDPHQGSTYDPHQGSTGDPITLESNLRVNLREARSASFAEDGSPLSPEEDRNAV